MEKSSIIVRETVYFYRVAISSNAASNIQRVLLKNVIRNFVSFADVVVLFLYLNVPIREEAIGRSKVDEIPAKGEKTENNVDEGCSFYFEASVSRVEKMRKIWWLCRERTSLFEFFRLFSIGWSDQTFNLFKIVSRSERSFGPK